MTTCKYCGGSGVVRGTGTVPCAACESSGRILGETCSECHGLEFQVIEIDALCSPGEGIGFIPSDEAHSSLEDKFPSAP